VASVRGLYPALKALQIVKAERMDSEEGATADGNSLERIRLSFTSRWADDCDDDSAVFW